MFTFLFMHKLDSTKVQSLGAISERINETRHCTAASYEASDGTQAHGRCIPVNRASFSQTGSISR